MNGEGEEETSLSLTSLDIEQLLQIFIGILASKAWQYIGLQLAPGKKETVKDLKRASTAIDCISLISEKLKPYLSDEEAESLRNLITDLKINYAKNA
ncbi:DUF1844 domain-containing protein [Candidatus Bathyarchaeota archaeon]|nr:DUF1844 domain-containing protein [Candidatus Bathyarchaeota archaeon]